MLKLSVANRKTQLIILSLAVCVVAIGFLAWLSQTPPPTSEPTFPTKWFTVKSGQSNKPKVTLKLEAFMVDIPAPTIKSITGKAKFLPYTSPKSYNGSVGYILDVEAEPLDQSKLPDKYKKSVTTMTENGPLTIMPLEEATYEAHFVLRFLDADGFEIHKEETGTFNIETGKTNRIQSQAENIMPLEQAQHTANITVQLVLDKCLSANDKSRDK